MILGIGLDILTLKDIARSLKSPGFCRQVFSPNELHFFSDDPTSLAQAFALKEAWVKALGTGRIGGIEFHEIDCSSLSTVIARGGAKTTMDALGIKHSQASVQTLGGVVVASVILLS